MLFFSYELKLHGNILKLVIQLIFFINFYYLLILFKFHKTVRKQETKIIPQKTSLRAKVEIHSTSNKMQQKTYKTKCFKL